MYKDCSWQTPQTKTGEILHKPKIGTYPVSRPLPIDSLSPAWSHSVYRCHSSRTLQVAEQPTTFSHALQEVDHLSDVSGTCWRHAKEPLNQLKYTIRVNIMYCSRCVKSNPVFDSVTAVQFHVCFDRKRSCWGQSGVKTLLVSENTPLTAASKARISGTCAWG